MAAIIEVEFFNSYWMKRIQVEQVKSQLEIQEDDGNGTVTKGFNWQKQVPGSGSSPARGVWPLSNCYAPPQTYRPNFIDNDLTNPPNFRAALKPNNWYIEEISIRGSFNGMETDIGARAFLDEDEPLQQHRFNSLIYSGVFNSRTGINRTNEFPIGTNITKSANPEYGSIQKTYAEETNLLILQENKCQRALIDKDTIYTSEGGTQTLPQGVVIGQITPYAGEYGISKNPESFAIYGFRKYFTDRNRNAVLRLSHDGITEISEYGMRDWFRDNLATLEDKYINEFVVEASNIDIVPTATGQQYQTGFAASFVVLKSNTNVNYISDTVGNTLVGCVVQYKPIGGAKFVDAIGDNGEVLTVVGTQSSTPFRIYLSDTSDQLMTNVDPQDISFPNKIVNGVRFVSKNRGYIKGGWDIYSKQYICSIQYNDNASLRTDNSEPSIGGKDYKYYTLGFDEKNNGWTSFYTYRPGLLGSLKANFYTANNFYSNWFGDGVGDFSLYEHYKEQLNSPNRGVFYGKAYPSTVTIIANALPSVEKNFLAIDYEGSNGWKVVENSLVSDATGFTFFNSDWRDYVDEANEVYSYYEGQYDGAGNEGSAASASNPPLQHAGFNRKNNRYMANLVRPQNVGAPPPNPYPSLPMPGEVIYGDQVSGIKGYFATVTLATDTETDPEAMKELYQVSLTYVTR